MLFNRVCKKHRFDWGFFLPFFISSSEKKKKFQTSHCRQLCTQSLGFPPAHLMILPMYTSCHQNRTYWLSVCVPRGHIRTNVWEALQVQTHTHSKESDSDCSGCVHITTNGTLTAKTEIHGTIITPAQCFIINKAVCHSGYFTVLALPNIQHTGILFLFNLLN